jgi:hypothetical protein
MTVSTTFNRTVKVEGATYDVAGSPYDLDDNLAARFIHRGWASGTISGTLTVTMAADFKSGGQLYEQDQTYEIAQPLAGFLISEGRATVAGGTADLVPEDVAVTITVTQPSVVDPAGETFIGYLTVTNAADQAKTNEVLAFGYPTAPDWLPEGTHLRVYDDDGSGGLGSVLPNFQINYVCSDGDGARRQQQVVGILPALGASSGGSKTRKLHLFASAVAPPGGTAITAADVLATAARILLTVTFADGSQFFFDTDDAFDAGVGSTKSKTGYSRTVLGASGCATDFELFGPLLDNTDTPHNDGDGLYARLFVRAVKVGTGAVDGGNPITLFQLLAGSRIENGDAARGSGDAAHYRYDLNVSYATSLSDGTMISTDGACVHTGEVLRHDFPSSEPATSITVSGSGATGARTITLGAGNWASAIKGAHIVSLTGAGKAYVETDGGSNVVTAGVYEAFADPTLSSGEWRIEGVGHHYNTPFLLKPIWIGNKPTHVHAWGDCGDAVSPANKAPLDHLIAAKMFPNFQVAYADITHDTTDIDALLSPDNSRHPFAWPSGSFIGDIEKSLTGGAERSMVDWFAIMGFGKFTQAGRRRVIWNAMTWATGNDAYPILLSTTPSVGEIGAVPRADNDVSYKWNGAYGTGMSMPTPYSPREQGDTGHTPEPVYALGLYTGDPAWTMLMVATATYSSFAMNPAYNGAGINTTWFGDGLGENSFHMGNLQVRAKALVARDWLHALALTPDSFPESILPSKTYMRARWAKSMDALKAYGPDDVLGKHPGTGNQPAFMEENGDPEHWGLQTIGLVREALGFARELGELDADGEACAEWLSDCAAQAQPTDDVSVRGYFPMAYWSTPISSRFGITMPSDMAGWHKQTLGLGPITENAYTYRSPAGTVSIDANKAGSVNITFSADQMSGGGTAFYGTTGFIRRTDIDGVIRLATIAGDGLSATGTIGYQGAGTVSVANGSPNVTGSGTAFPSNLAGKYIDIAGTVYQVLSRSSETSITLTSNYSGATASGVTYHLGVFGATGNQSNILLPGPHKDDYDGEYDGMGGGLYPHIVNAGNAFDIDGGYNVSVLTAAIAHNRARDGFADIIEHHIAPRA